MKEEWRTQRAKRREYEQKLAAATPKDQADADRRKVESEALAKANARIVRSEVKAAAAGKLADPSDAYKFLDLDQFEVDDDGNVDEDEIRSEEHTSELQSRGHIVCRLLLEQQKDEACAP